MTGTERGALAWTLLLTLCLASNLSAQQGTRLVQGTDELRVAYWPADQQQADIILQDGVMLSVVLLYSLGQDRVGEGTAAGRAGIVFNAEIFG